MTLFSAVIVLVVAIGICEQMPQLPRLVASEPYRYSGTFVWNLQPAATKYHLQWTTNQSDWPRNQFVVVAGTRNVVTVSNMFLSGVQYFARVRVLEPDPGSFFGAVTPFTLPGYWPTNLVAIQVESTAIPIKSNAVWKAEWVVVLTNPPGAKAFRTRAFKPYE